MREVALNFLNRTLGFHDRMGGLILTPTDLIIIETVVSLVPDLWDEYYQCESNFDIMEKVVDPLINHLVYEYDIQIEKDDNELITKYYI